MPVGTAEIDRLRQLTRAQLEEISRDFLQPMAVQRAARAILRDLTRERLVAAVRDFDAALPVFVDLTKKLHALTEEARKDPVGDAVAQLALTLRRFGQIFDKVGDEVHEPPAKTSAAAPLTEPPGLEAPPAPPEPTAPPASSAPPAPAGMDRPRPPAASAPPGGTATISRRFEEVADEYVATFRAATIDPARSAAVDRVRRKLVGFKSEYEQVESMTRVPWHLIGLIHAMESSFNFGTHLHNGDSLVHRTQRVPAGRPSPDVADPPFAWSTSALDALTRGGHALHLVERWTLARQLFELERYNGFGYRMRGIATPYLWSFSDRYVKGKFVRDGVFDPDAISGQAGAAVILKALVTAADISEPA